MWLVANVLDHKVVELELEQHFIEGFLEYTLSIFPSVI